MSREDKRSYQRVRVCCGLTGTSAPLDPFRLSEAPAAGYQLPHSIWTRRKSRRFDFHGESGNRVCLSLCFENGKGGVRTGVFEEDGENKSMEPFKYYLEEYYHRLLEIKFEKYEIKYFQR